METEASIITKDDLILVTGAAGFIGVRLLRNLLDRGFRNIRCFVRPSSDLAAIKSLLASHSAGANVQLFKGNLGSRDDCARTTENAALIYHLAAGRGEK